MPPEAQRELSDLRDRLAQRLISVRRAMRSITRTAATGKRPMAVSPDSIIASVPSKIAVATSVTSALVGRGFWTIDSSICVAVMTGLP